MKYGDRNVGKHKVKVEKLYRVTKDNHNENETALDDMLGIVDEFSSSSSATGKLYPLGFIGRDEFPYILSCQSDTAF